MKTIKILITIILLFGVTISQAQKVEYNGVNYVVKKNAIFMDGKDITTSLSPEQHANIKNRLSQQILADKKLKEAQKEQKKAEKRQKAAEKRQKKAENEIKKKEKAKKNYSDAQDRYEKQVKRHEKLKNKGKLSPEDEVKWQKKLEGLQKQIEKTKRKM
jgi:protein subunit release factor B